MGSPSENFFLDNMQIRCKKLKADLTPVITRLVSGLAGKCRSFESVNYPGQFLRHQNFRLKLAKKTDDKVFKEDATFCFVEGLASSQARSFESVNFPKHYIRHSNFELWLVKSDGNQLFKKDATFIISPPLTEHPPSVIID